MRRIASVLDRSGPSCCSSLSALPGLTLWLRTHCSSPPRRTHLAPSTRNAQEPSPHSSDPSVTCPSSPSLPCTSTGELETLLRALEHLRLPHYNLCLLIGYKVAGGGDSVYQFVLCWILNTYFSIYASLIQTTNSLQSRNGAWATLSSTGHQSSGGPKPAP